MPRLQKYWQCPVLALLMITTTPRRTRGVHRSGHSHHGARTAHATAVAWRWPHRRGGLGSDATTLVDARGGRIDQQFDNDVLLPGFIDPTCTRTACRADTVSFLAPDDWSLPTGDSRKTTPEGYRARLTELAGQHSDRTVPLLPGATIPFGTAKYGGMT